MSRQWLIGILILVGVIAFSSHGLKGGPDVSAREASVLLKSKPAPIVIDVRESAAFDQGRIAGARSIPIAEFKAQLKNLKLPQTEVILIYDEDDTGAREATKLLYENGHQGALTIKGGIAAWREAGHPVDKPPGDKPPAAKPK